MASPQQQVGIRVDLGPRVTIETISAVLGDLSTVCSFAGDLQRVVDRNEATYTLMSRPSRYMQEIEEWELFDDPRWFDLYRGRYGKYPPVLPFPPGLDLQQSPRLNRAVQSLLREREAEDDAVVRVQELRYSNPVELIILASGVVVLGVLKLVRDWPSRRALNDAVAEDYRSVCRDREHARRIALDQLEAGGYRLSRSQIDELLSKDVSDALEALGDSRLEIEGLKEPGSQE